VAVANEFETRTTDAGINVVAGRLDTTGEIVEVKVTVPENPLRLARLIVKVVLVPGGTVWEKGLAEIVKSGFGTVTLTTVECVRVPFVAVIVTV
jgi:hypothetical protein